ncbi:MAG: 2-oxoacid:ferredoxin oxidoreductase subunit beta [Deltaproteobacteria bacterium]|nr:2-oxoacid:ferredoxin oxidoreductase subunit beta [Deltaproteobacteria bacterium]MBW2122939.1 2-oxoacid:ferredoxin oxidoreductase subunit beta [Deltaproteobacteria bacterium]
MARVMEKYLRPGLKGTPFCPGCGHGILMGAILRAVDGLGLDMDRTLFVSGIGCAAWIPSPHFQADTLHTLHGRAIPFATGAKLFSPDLTVIVISGDGDLSSIGGNHLIHAARRDLDLTVICANNMIYGMTGGQVASTTPVEAVTSTTPRGNPYRPFDLCRLVEAAGATYVARFSVTQPLALIESIKRAIGNRGFSFVEVLSPCPTQFGRRNRYDQPAEMITYLMDHCVTLKKAERMSESEREEMIVTGEFVPCPA